MYTKPHIQQSLTYLLLTYVNVVCIHQLKKLTPWKHRKYYIHRSAIKRLYTRNHHSHYIHRPVLKIELQQTITTIISTVLPRQD